MKKKLILTSVIFLAFIKVTAQEIKFGKVSKQELQETVYPLDSTAKAAILYKKRKSFYKYSISDGFKLITNVHERIKIYSKGGLEWAKKTILTNRNNYTIEKVKIKGYTYNLEAGKIIKEKLNNDDIFFEKTYEYRDSHKFTMPNVKVGSVIEWNYTVTSPFAGHIEDVIFQYKIPVKRIEAKIEIPQYFKFKYLPNFYYPIKIIASKENRTINYSYKMSGSDNPSYKASTSQLASKTENVRLFIYEQVYSASEENIPAIKEEPLINNIDNYIAKIHFEHTYTKFPNSSPKYYSTDWESVAKSIHKSSFFGKQLQNTNYLSADVAAQISEVKTDQEKALNLFHFLKTQIKWNGLYGKYTDKGLKKSYQNHEGNVADINLNLVALFREAGLKSDPVLISTRAHGIPLFPTIDGFNYVIAALELPTGLVLFDATEMYCPPNMLPTRVLNWQGRLVRKNGTSSTVNLSSIQPAKERVNLFVKINKDGTMEGLKRSFYFTNNALNYRKNKAFLVEKSLLPILEEENNSIEINELKIANKQDISKPIIESFKFEADDQCDVINDKIYFSPLLFLAISKNPFTQEERLYPVDFTTKRENTYTVSIQIPDGYTISSLPKNIAIALPDSMGEFRYMVTKKGEKNIQVMAIIKINRPSIPANYYQDLKEFYKTMLEKQTEKVVLTKL